MTWRKLTKADLDILFEVYEAALGFEVVGKEKARQAWMALLNSFGFSGVVVEADASGKPQARGFGASIIVSNGFAEKNMTLLRPELNARLIAELLTHTGSVLSKAQIAEENAGEGINVLILCGRWTLADSTPEDKAEVQMHLASYFIEKHVGYRFKRMFAEVCDEQDFEYATATKVYRVIPYSAADTSVSGIMLSEQKRALAVIELQDVRSLAGAILAPLFQSRRPTLGLRTTDQELLNIAVHGATDRELSYTLGVSLTAIKRRWEDVYERASQAGLEFGIDGQIRTDESRRGLQKRHHLLAYLRRHPEELRPFVNGGFHKNSSKTVSREK